MLAVQTELFDPPAPVVGSRLRVARWLAGYSQSELARLTGLSATAVSEVECGRREVGLERFADILPTTASFLQKQAPILQMATAHDSQLSAKAGYLIGVVIADLHAYASPLLDLSPSPVLMASAAQSAAPWAATVRDQLGLGSQGPIGNVIALAERLGIFVASTGSQAGPLFVAGVADGAPVAAIPAGPDAAVRRWAAACAVGTLAVAPSGQGLGAGLRLAAELLMPESDLLASHRADWSTEENAAQWGVPATVYGAVAGRHGLQTSECGSGERAKVGWEQSATVMSLLARLRSDGVGLEDVSTELGYPTSVLRGLVRGLASSSV